MSNRNNVRSNEAAAIEAKLAEAEAKLAAITALHIEAENAAIVAQLALADTEAKLRETEAKLAEKPVSTGGKLSKKLFVKALLSVKACTITEVTSALVAEYGNGGDTASQSLINDLRYIDKTPVGRIANEAGRGFKFYMPQTEADEVYMLRQALAAKQAEAEAEAKPSGDASNEAENTSASE